VPTILNQMFWGGLWGLLFAAIADPLPPWPLLLLGGAVGVLGPVLASWFVVAPLKGNPIAAGWVPQRMLAGILINGCWGSVWGCSTPGCAARAQDHGRRRRGRHHPPRRKGGCVAAVAAARTPARLGASRVWLLVPEGLSQRSLDSVPRGGHGQVCLTRTGGGYGAIPSPRPVSCWSPRPVASRAPRLTPSRHWGAA